MKLISDGLNKEAKKDFQFKAKHKSPSGGLSEAGRKAYNRATGSNLKRPQPEGGSRRDSFCARMKGMKKKLTSKETSRDPDSRINKALRKWKCSYDMSEVKEAASKAKNQENAEQLKSRLLDAIKAHDGKILGATPYYTTNLENGIVFRDKNNKMLISSPSYLPGHEIQEIDESIFEPGELKEDLDAAIKDYIKQMNTTKLLSVNKEAARKGLWANVHAKRKRGEAPAKPGDKDYPDSKNWKEVTQESEKEAASETPSARMSVIYPNDDFTPESYALTVDSQRILNPEIGIITTEDYQDFTDDPKYLAKLFNMPGVREALESKKNQHQKEAAGRCWKGYEPVPGKKPLTKGSCRPISASKETEKKANDAAMASKIMNIQQFMGQNPRRELSEEETKKVEDRKNSLLPTFFPNYGDSPTAKIYSPILPTLGAGGIGAGLGAILGGTLFGEQTPRAGFKHSGPGAVGGALGLGGALALLAYLKRKQENANVEEIMRRLPRGATLRDYEADPLIQKNLDRKMQMDLMTARYR